MAFESVLITGANKGIGLEFVRQFVSLNNPPKFVFATYRNESLIQELKNIKESSQKTKVILIHMDVKRLDHIKEARNVVETTVGTRGLRLLVNNAGICDQTLYDDVTEFGMLEHFQTNTVGPVMVLKEMLPLLKQAALVNQTSERPYRSAVLNISSFVSSIDNVPRDVHLYPYAYRISKAALNMAIRSFAFSPQLQDSGILSVLMCPGWVRTDMGSQMADISSEESVADMLRTLNRLDMGQQGCFVDRHGNKISF